MSSAFIANVSTIPIPNPAELSVEESSILEDLQARKHLKKRKVATDKQGQVVVLADPLTADERTVLNALEQRVQDQQACFVGGFMEFKFSPKGKPGSIYEVHPRHAELLMKQHPGRLALMSADDVWNDANRIRPLQRTNVPLPFKRADTFKEARQNEITMEMDGNGRDVGSLSTELELHGQVPLGKASDLD